MELSQNKPYARQGLVLACYLLFRGLTVLAILLSCGCHTVNVLHRDPTFRVQALQTGSLAIGAVAGQGNGEYYLAPGISAMLCETFKANYPQLQVYPLEETKRLLPGARPETFLSEFSKEGTLGQEELRLFLPLRPQARYVLLVNVDEDQGNGMLARSQRIHRRWHEDASTGEYRWKYFYRRRGMITSHRMSSTFFICDLKTQQPVWIATGSSDVATESGVQNSPIIESAVGVQGTSSLDVMRTIALELVRQLPQ